MKTGLYPLLKSSFVKEFTHGNHLWIWLGVKNTHLVAFFRHGSNSNMSQQQCHQFHPLLLSQQRKGLPVDANRICSCLFYFSNTEGSIEFRKTCNGNYSRQYGGVDRDDWCLPVDVVFNCNVGEMIRDRRRVRLKIRFQRFQEIL
jgi:hypothetical protein